MELPIRKIVLLIFLGIILNVNSSYGLRILGIFPLNGKSHFVMIGSLMRGLAERGHQVDVYSHFPLKKSVPNYTDFSLDGTLPAIANNFTYEVLTNVTQSFSASRLLQKMSPICNLLNLPVFQELIKNPPKDPPYDVVITEIFLTDCYLAWGRHFNIPMVAVSTTAFFDWMHAPLGNPSNPAVEASLFLQSVPPMSFFQRVKNFYVSTRAILEYNYYVQEQNAIVKKNFGPNYPDVAELHKDVSLVLLNHHHAFNGVKAFTPAVVPVAGLHIVDNGEDFPSNVQKFLNESKDGFIYLSFGSMIQFETFPKEIQDAFYNTFKKMAPIRVLMKIASPEKLPTTLPTNVICHRWLPQIKVLKHKNIKAFITHGGAMGTQESIYYAVPMVGIPLMADQYFNLLSYSKKNMAVILDKNHLTQEAVEGAITEILKNPVYKKSVEKVSKTFRDAPMSPMDTSEYWIKYVVRHGKDALRSPLVDMPWWQANLLDVYGFIVSIVLIVLLTIKFIIKRLLGILCMKKHSKSKLKKN